LLAQALRFRAALQLNHETCSPKPESLEPEFIPPIKTINFHDLRWRNKLLAPALFQGL
jgi:hypothetical protein